MSTPDVDTMKDLLARVEAADRGSVELDAAIHRALVGPIVKDQFADGYTISQDAATALIRSALPDASWGVSVEAALQIEPPFDVKYHAYVGDHWPRFKSGPGKWWGESSYRGGAALALCEALLRALIAKAEAGEGS